MTTARRITEAHLDLLCDGDLHPSRSRIARRAGVAEAEISQQFPTQEALFAAAVELMSQWRDAASIPVPPTLALDERLARFCAQRVRLLEIVSPAARAAMLREPDPPVLRDARARHLRRVRDEVAEVFAPELAVAGPGLLMVITVAVSLPTWASLREDWALSAEDAHAMMRQTVTALLSDAVASALRQT